MSVAHLLPRSLRAALGAVCVVLAAAGACAPQPHAPVPVAQSADLVARPPTQPTPVPQCAGEVDPYGVEVVLRWADGSPAGDVPVGFDPDSQGRPQEIGRTDAEGRLVAQLDHVGRLSVLGTPTSQAPRCTRPPRETVVAHEEFTLGRLCPVRVTTKAADGAPIIGTRLGWEARQGSTMFRGEAQLASDANGAVDLPDLPCGAVSLHAWRSGLAQTRSDRGVPSGLRAPCIAGDLENVRTCFVTSAGTAAGEDPPTVNVEMGPAVELHGRILDRNGQPVSGARVALILVGDTITDSEGRYDLWIPPGVLREKRFLAVHSPDHTDVTVEVFGDEGSDGLADAAEGGVTGWNRDIQVEPTHPITVHCAGFPGDRCDSLIVTCGGQGEKAVHECADDDPSRCECPAASSSMIASAGGVSVFVEPAATTAWLDFRPLAGGIRGSVSGGECVIRADRPAELRADPTRPPESRLAPCAADHTFSFDHMAPGPWELRVVRRGAAPGVPVTVEVQAEVIELGLVGE